MWSCYIKEKFESKEVSYIDQKSSVECLLIKIKDIIAKGQLLLGKDENLVCVRPTAPGPHKWLQLPEVLLGKQHRSTQIVLQVPGMNWGLLPPTDAEYAD